MNPEGHLRLQAWPAGLAGLLLTLLSTAPSLAFRADDDAAKSRNATLSESTSPAPLTATTAARRLRAEMARRQGLEIEWNSTRQAPSRVRGSLLDRLGNQSALRTLTGIGQSEANARVALRCVADIFGIRNTDTEFTIRRHETDPLGLTHTRMTQQYAGIPVIGGELITHVDRLGRPYEVNGHYVADLTLNPAPTLTPADAAARATLDLRAASLSGIQTSRAPRLVILSPPGATPALTYELTLTAVGTYSPTEPWRYWIDATNGTIRLKYANLATISPPSDIGVHTLMQGTNLPLEGGILTQIPGWLDTSGYCYLYNTNLRWFVYNYDMNSNRIDKGTYAYRGATNWLYSDPTEISAAYNLHATQSYYTNRFARRSFDNSNSFARINVHYPYNPNNAFYDPETEQFYFGDGDTVQYDPFPALDVLAHEFTHGVTGHSADLFYYGESGALNESFSDIFGTCVEFATQPPGTNHYPSHIPGHYDWLLGEDVSTNGPFRDMRNPGSLLLSQPQPSYYLSTNWWIGAGDNGGVHINSGVQNFFFYLLSDGGVGMNDIASYHIIGIGITNAEQIAYRALTMYCSAFTDYKDVRGAWLSAARDLNGDWVPVVSQCWAAVGVKFDTECDPAGGIPLSVNATNLPWFTGGNASWFSQNQVTHDGVMAAQSGPVNYLEHSRIQTLITNGPGTVTYWWKVASEPGYDRLRFLLDNKDCTNITGNIAWKQESVTVPWGSHLLAWDYSKDWGGNLSYDAGWLDQVNWTPQPLTTLIASDGTYEDRVVITWDPVTHAASYEIWRATQDDITQAQFLGETTNTTISDTLAVSRVIYFYWVRARSIGDISKFSESDSGWRPAVEIINASDGTSDQMVRIAWSPSQVPNFSGYVVYRNTQNDVLNAMAIGRAELSPFDDTTAVGGVLYYYWIKVDAPPALDILPPLGKATRKTGYYDFSTPDTGWRAIESTPTPPTPTPTPWLATPTPMPIATEPVHIPTPAPISRTDFDFDGDGKADPTLYSADAGRWLACLSSLNYTPMPATLGGASYVPVARDFDGDGKTDMAVYDETTGIWLVILSGSGYTRAGLRFGVPGFTAVPSDFDGDRRSDPTLYSRTTGEWLALLSSCQYAPITLRFGGTGFSPVPSDFDGDAKADPAVYSESTGEWFILSSAAGYAASQIILGGFGWTPVPADFDGSGKASVAVYQNSQGIWSLAENGVRAAHTLQMGNAGFLPVPGDYDGDRIMDPAVYDLATGCWYAQLSSTGTLVAASLGALGYMPAW